MNPDKKGPKKPVPPISAGDTWDDVDDEDGVAEDSDAAIVSLPPRKGDAGPAEKKKKEKAMPGVNHVSAPKAKGKVGSAKPASRKSPKAGLATGDKEVEPTPDFSGEPANQQTILPAAQTSKWANVKQINPGNDALQSRPAKSAQKLAPVAPDSEQDETPQKRRRFFRGERRDWGEWSERISKRSVKWIALTGTGVVALVVLAVFRNQTVDDGRTDQPSLFTKIELEGQQVPADGGDLGSIGVLAKGLQTAKDTFGNYACAQSADGVMDLVYEPERNRESIARKWKPVGMKAGWKPAENSKWTVSEDGALNYGILEGSLADFTEFTAFFRCAKEGLRIDWKATSGYSSAEYGDLKAGKGDASEIRAWLSLADFFTFSYPEKEFRCFRVIAPDGILNIWGYVPIGGELDQTLLKKFKPGQISDESANKIQVILRLDSGKAGSLPDQWVISEIVRMSWLDS